MTIARDRRERRHIPVLGALVALLGLGPGARAQPGTPAASAHVEAACPSYEVSATEPMEVVRYLAADELEGRLSGSPGAACAADYIASAFADIGLEPAGPDGWFQEVPLASAANPHAPGGTGRNVLGLLPGSDPALAGSAVVIGAHYDHLGRGGFGSTGEAGEVHNGADDNASGVAAMVEAARRLAADARPARSVLFIAFTGEELGLLGSAHYARHPAVPLDRTVAMVNLDMVGRLGDRELIVYGMGTAPEWEGIVVGANADGLPLAFEASGFGPSDHTSFYANEIPVLHLFSNVHGDYHRPSDDWEKIDAAGLERVAGLTARLAADLAERASALTVIPGVGERAERSEGYGAWLGTVPDFTPVDHGVLLAGVAAGSPAEEAGLERGDILIGLADFEIADLQAFTDALRAHRPGDEVPLRWLRDGRTLEATARLGDRADRPR